MPGGRLHVRRGLGRGLRDIRALLRAIRTTRHGAIAASCCSSLVTRAVSAAAADVRITVGLLIDPSLVPLVLLLIPT